METQSHNYEVVPLSEEYLDWFVNTASRNMLHEELKKPEFFNAPHILGLARQVMDAGSAIVILYNGQPVGTIAGMLIGNLFNPRLLVLAELMWYVLPEYRNTRAGLLLLNNWEQIAEKVNAYEMTFSTLPSSKVSLEKRGYSLVEYAYRKRVYGRD